MAKVNFSVVEHEGKYYRIIRQNEVKPLLSSGKVIYSIDRELINLNEIDDEIRQEMRKRGIKHVVHLGDC